MSVKVGSKKWFKREATKRWHQRDRKANPAKYLLRKQARRALVAGQQVSVTEWQSVLERYWFRCVWCGSDAGSLTVDHVIPLSNGGLHHVDNLVPACRSCNSRKGARLWKI